MFITTKAEFIWDISLNKYVEVYTDGYEYNGELALADTEDQYYSGIGGSGGSSGGTPSYELTMEDFATMSGEDLMFHMGYSPSDIQKYSEFVPQYDDWREGFAEKRYDIETGVSALKSSQIRGKEASLQESYGLQLKDLENKMSGTLGQGEQSLYNIYSQSQQIAAGGLGGRQGISRRSRKGISGDVSSALGGLSSQGLQMKNNLASALSDLSVESGLLDFQSDLSALDYQEDVEASRSAHSDDVWAFLTSLLMQDTSIAPTQG